ncbi:hypothetical protein AAG906_035435 [Vitis piasezkii]
MSPTYLLVLFLGLVVLTTPSLADYPKPLQPRKHKSPTKPPKGEKPLPEHKPPTPIGKPPKGETPLPEYKPPTPVGKPPKGEKPPHYGHNPGHPPVESKEDSYKPPHKIEPPSAPMKKPEAPGKKPSTPPHKPPHKPPSPSHPN